MVTLRTLVTQAPDSYPGGEGFLYSMELTRTERLILETAADLFQFEIGAARASTMTSLELTPAELEATDGGRAQLGDVMVARGWLTPDQLEQVLDRVYGELQGWSERLATPKPKPVPRPAQTQPQNAQLAELVEQLTGLLDVLVAGEPGDSTVIRRAPAALSRASSPITASVFSASPKTRVEEDLEGEDDDTKDIPALSTRAPGSPPLDEADAPTLSRERSRPASVEASAEEDEEDAPTLHMQRAAPPAPDLTQGDSGTLHVERPLPGDDDTVHLERSAISPDRSGVEFTWAPPEDDDTVHFERPAGGAVHAQRSVISTGDTVIIEGTSSGSSSH